MAPTGSPSTRLSKGLRLPLHIESPASFIFFFLPDVELLDGAKAADNPCIDLTWLVTLQLHIVK